MTSIGVRDTRATSNRRLWIAQGVLAAIFLFTGGTKLVTPATTLAAQSHLPGGLMKFVGVCETLGALGLILPGLFGIQRQLTPLAAAGLVGIMIGATIDMIVQGQAAFTFIPVIVGMLAAYVARGRSREAL